MISTLPSKRRKRCAAKIISFVVLLTFTSLQILPPGWAQTVTLESDLQKQIPETTLSEPPDSSDASIIPTDSVSFLQNDSPLSPPTADPIETNQDYEYERYDFEAAIDLLRPEYASAVVVESLREEGLHSLSELSFEVGIAVLHGEIVLFSSGNGNEIIVTQHASKILGQASFTAHTHPLEHQDSGPSDLDLESAGHDWEYVISGNSVYAYNHQGEIREVSYSEFIQALNEALGEARKTHGQNLVKARGVLNFFIQEMDRLNQVSSKRREEIFRQAEVSAFADDFNRTTSLGTNWTVIQGSFSIDSQQTLYQNCCTSQGKLIYTGTLSSSDYDIQMDTFYTDAMTARGLLARYQDANNYYYAKVGRDGDAKIFKMVGGVSTQLGSTYDGPWFTTNTWHQIKFSLQGSTLSFYVDGVLRVSVQDTTFVSGSVGIASDGYYVRSDNFVAVTAGTTPQITPPSINPIPTYTNQTTLTLSGTKPANTSVWINGEEKVASNSSTSWSVPMTLSTQTSYTFQVQTKDALGNFSSMNMVSTTLDTVNPIITSTVLPSTVTSTTATITWITDEQTDSVIEYGTTSSLGLSTTNSSFVTNHSWTIRSLTTGTTYYWRVKSKDRAGNTVYSAISTFKTLTAAEATTSFQESGGLLAMEGENYHTRIDRNGKTWDVWASVQGFSGSGYPFTTPGCCVNQDTDYMTMSPELQYKINIQNPGTYYVWLRGLAWDQWSDSFHVGLDGAGLTPSDRIKLSNYGTFAWTKDTFDGVRATINIATAGEHILNLWMADDGTFLDKIILTQDPNFVPTSYGPPESGRAGSVTVNPPTVDALPTFTNSTSTTLSGTKPANTSIWVNGVERVALDALTTWSYSEPLPIEGVNSFTITTKDNAGNQSAPVGPVSITRDAILPTASIAVNGGATYTTSRQVQITINATDATSGVLDISYSPDGNANTWEAWEPYTSGMTITKMLSDQDGPKIPYVRVRDRAGNITYPYANITLDTTPPTGSVKINNDASSTNSTAVTLNLTGSDLTSGIDEMRFSTDGVNWTDWEPFNSTKSNFILPTGDGFKMVYVEFKDNAGLVAQFSDEITLATTPEPGTATPDPTLTSANLTSFSGSPRLVLMDGSSSNTQIIQQSPAQFRINYDVTQAGAKSGAYVSFDNPSTGNIEISNLSALSDFVIGASGPSGSQIRLEVEDSLGAKSEVLLSGLNSTAQYYRISKSQFSGIDWTKVRRFTYSIDDSLTTVSQGTLTIQTKILLYHISSASTLPDAPVPMV
ncbi:MAG: hypothetical protein HY584_04305, partial [Candidatus Omnitrophica bacterium]|nr:hypothetical protein [Candidatus Omnitrophota bacterium]